MSFDEFGGKLCNQPLEWIGKAEFLVKAHICLHLLTRALALTLKMPAPVFALEHAKKLKSLALAPVPGLVPKPASRKSNSKRHTKHPRRLSCHLPN